MHFSIPETQELKDSKNGHTYMAYNIHANGFFHCILRYKQFYNFNEQLKKEFGSISLPYFPPKKLLPLNRSQIEERRSHLEKYIQIISQDQILSQSDIFNGFLLQAQEETHNICNEKIGLEVYLMNWHVVKIEVFSNDKSSKVLEKVCKSINLPDSYLPYFSLFMIRKDEKNLMLLKKMMDFESPSLTLKKCNVTSSNHFLVIRKNYWDPVYDKFLFDNKVAINLLYAQIVNDIEKNNIQGPEEVKRELTTLQAKGFKKEFIELAKTLKYYGCTQFELCVCDYPQPNTQVIINAGGKGLIFTTIASSSNQSVEYNFRVTRIRCWRLTSGFTDSSSFLSQHKIQFLLSFEYLFCKDNLKWITVTSEQAIFISICLRGMVEELLMKRKGLRISEAWDSLKSKKGEFWSYLKRDGTSKQFILSKPSNQFFSNSNHKSFEKSNCHIRPLMENDAFDGIGDDDL